MKTASNSLFSATLTALCLTAMVTQPALARDRQTTVAGANGKAATRDVSRAQGDVSSSTTNAPGRTLASRQVDRSPGQTSATTTGPRGNTTTRDTTRSGSGSSTTVTGPNGQTGSVTVSR